MGEDRCHTQVQNLLADRDQAIHRRVLFSERTGVGQCLINSKGVGVQAIVADTDDHIIRIKAGRPVGIEQGHAS